MEFGKIRVITFWRLIGLIGLIRLRELIELIWLIGLIGLVGGLLEVSEGSWRFLSLGSMFENLLDLGMRCVHPSFASFREAKRSQPSIREPPMHMPCLLIMAPPKGYLGLPKRPQALPRDAPAIPQILFLVHFRWIWGHGQGMLIFRTLGFPFYVGPFHSQCPDDH